jgi:hypothetical protein
LRKTGTFPTISPPARHRHPPIGHGRHGPRYRTVAVIKLAVSRPPPPTGRRIVG